MSKIIYLMCIFSVKTICSQQITTTSALNESLTASSVNASENRPYSPENDPGDETLQGSEDDPVPEVVLDSASGVNIPQDTKPKNKLYCNLIPADIFEKFSPTNLLKPIQEKLTKIKEFLAYSNHPNYGGIQFLSPQHIWERLHEKGHNFLTGVNGAVFGLANLENHDYPFAYRQIKPVKRSRRNAGAVKDILTNYKEVWPFMFNYNVSYEKIGKENESYKFPHLKVKKV